MSDWIPHDGGKCPVAPGTMVDVRWRDRTEHLNSRADNWEWGNYKSQDDIVAYRVVSAPVDREFRRAVFLAVLPTMVDWDWSSSEKMMQKAWKLADEAIAQEGA